MTRLIIPTFAAVALIAAATTVLQPPSPLAVAAAGMQERHTAAGVNNLPIENFEDMSLVYSSATKR
jgi:hypothetical protein